MGTPYSGLIATATAVATITSPHVGAALQEPCPRHQQARKPHDHGETCGGGQIAGNTSDGCHSACYISRKT